MTNINILGLLLLLVAACAADHFRNESALSLKRIRRLSHASYNEKTLHMAKFIVSIRTRTPHKYYGDNHFCGGVIVSPVLVLTSSHCVINMNRAVYSSRVFLVVAGTPNRLRYQKGRSFHTTVKQIVVPDNFTLRNEQDICMLVLRTPLPRDWDSIAMADLPLRPIEVGTMCSVIGWGRMFRSGPISAKLLHINIKIIQSKLCSKMLDIIKNDLLCGLDQRINSAQHPCVGDRGAPLMNGRTIYGIVSHIVGCNAAQMPSVYTDVYQNVRWIRRVLIANGGYIGHVYFLLVCASVIASICI